MIINKKIIIFGILLSFSIFYTGCSVNKDYLKNNPLLLIGWGFIFGNLNYQAGFPFSFITFTDLQDRIDILNINGLYLFLDLIFLVLLFSFIEYESNIHSIHLIKNYKRINIFINYLFTYVLLNNVFPALILIPSFLMVGKILPISIFFTSFLLYFCLSAFFSLVVTHQHSIL